MNPLDIVVSNIKKYNDFVKGIKKVEKVEDTCWCPQNVRCQHNVTYIDVDNQRINTVLSGDKIGALIASDRCDESVIGRRKQDHFLYHLIDKFDELSIEALPHYFQKSIV